MYVQLGLLHAWYTHAHTRTYIHAQARTRLPTFSTYTRGLMYGSTYGLGITITALLVITHTRTHVHTHTHTHTHRGGTY